MLRKLLLLASIIFLIGHAAFCGNEGEGDLQVARVEIKAQSDQDSYRVLACSGTGVLLFFKSSEMVDGGKVKWYFSFYDTDLKQQWVKSISVGSEMELAHRQFSGDTAYLVYTYKGKQRSVDMPIEIVRIKPRPGSFIPNISKVPANSDPVFFSFARGKAFIGLNNKSGQSAVEIIDLRSNRSKGFLVDPQDNNSIQWFETDSSSLSTKMILAKLVGKKEYEYSFRVFDSTGKTRQAVNLTTINNDRTFVSLQGIGGWEGGFLVSGTYLLGLASSGKNKNPGECSGLFTSLLSAESQKSMNFFNFLEMRSLGGILSAKDVLDIKKKALKKNKNIAEYSAGLNVIQHSPLIVNDRILQVTEVFYPQYHTENFTDFDFYGRPYSNSYSVFDGYRFSGALVTAFSYEGKMLWDNSMEFREVISPELSPKLSVTPYGDNLLLAYVSQGKIASKVISDSATVGAFELSSIDLKYPDDKLIAETRSGLVHWYGSFFLSYGFQDIKNVALEGNNRRLVFYLTKVRTGD
jgi:hypothetical protein